MITRHILSQNNGGANGSKGFIHCLARFFEDFSLICPAFEDDASRYIPDSVKVYSYQDHRSQIQKGLDMWRGRICANEPFVKRHLKNHTYDIIIIDHSFSGASLVKVIKAHCKKLITIHHNVERDYQHDNRKEYSRLFRRPYIHYAIKAERQCLENSDINLTLTRHDLQMFQSWYPHQNLHLHSWGIFDYRPIANKMFHRKHKTPAFIITGSLCFMQSLGPIVEFVERYWPLVRQSYSDAHLTIAGRNPAEILVQTCESDNSITIIPNPEDMESLVGRANYYVCPINAGSGLKLRVMDGLKQGLPVLCHEQALPGYEQIAEDGCLFTYHDENSFVEALQKLHTTDIAPEIVYQSFKNCFSLEAGIDRIRHILSQENIL